jgi:hypothetical protein
VYRPPWYGDERDYQPPTCHLVWADGKSKSGREGVTDRINLFITLTFSQFRDDIDDNPDEIAFTIGDLA